MCGIAGIWWPGGQRQETAEAVASAMAARLHHRGPDARGVWADGAAGIALGHTRLSILDLSPAGAQPMASPSGRYVIVFNGEIYNHLDLRRDLEAAGAAPLWRGHSDTETLLALIERYGVVGALERANGMFAFGLWDRTERSLTLARDRIGEKPLYWGWAGRALVFASELKAVRAVPGFEPEMDARAASLFLRFSYVPAPWSIYRGVYKLEPGTILDVRGVPDAPPDHPLRPGDAYAGIDIQRYWSLRDTIEAGARDPITDRQEAADALEQVLRVAVRRQMLSDVPLGAFLSGGVDSSTVVALMQQESARPIRTFTIGFEEAAFNEAPFASAVARHLGTDHTERKVTERDALDVIPKLPEIYDEPFADSSQIPTHLVCHAARADVTVALSGDAGDELFGGYNRYFWGPGIWNRVAWLPWSVRCNLGRAIGAVPITAWDRLATLAAVGGRRAGGVIHLGDKAHRLAHRMETIKNEAGLYRSLVSAWEWPQLRLEDARTGAFTLLDDPLPVQGPVTVASDMMVQDLRTYLPDDILCKVDRAAMGVSLETRVPFLDADVIALSARIPLSLKINGTVGKQVLRDVLYRHVPRLLIERPKAGFGVPVGRWMRGPLREWADAHLKSGAGETDHLIDPLAVDRAWSDHQAGRRDETVKLWTLIMLKSWLLKHGTIVPEA
jgi:asparagine synthase (glutamine-hydrolysing)